MGRLGPQLHGGGGVGGGGGGGPCTSHGPLSPVKRISVFSSTPAALSAARTSPTIESTCQVRTHTVGIAMSGSRLGEVTSMEDRKGNWDEVHVSKHVRRPRTRVQLGEGVT